MVADLDGTQKGRGNNDERDETRLREMYSSYVSAWGSYHEGRNVLLSGYLLAHSFLIAATVLLFLPLKGTLLVGKLALLLFSLVGLILAIQMTLAWGRSVCRVSMFEWHLRRLESTSLWNKKGPKLFTDWNKLKKEPRKNIVNPDDLEDKFSANCAMILQAK